MTLPHPIRNIQRWRTVQAILLRYGFDFLIERNEIVEVRHILNNVLHLPMGQFSNLRLSERVRLMLQDLGPFYVKMGQILSSRADFLPEDWVNELSKLQDAVPPFPFEQVERILQAELGGPIEQFYAEFDPEPIAAASLGQVHQARLLTGEQVVVKVQRPNIQAQVQADVAIMREIARLIEARTNIGRRLALTSAIDEFARTLREEMDYRNEASNADRLRDNLASFPNVHVPRMYWELTTTRVLTMEAVTGIKISELDRIHESGCSTVELADVFIRSIFKQLLIDGFFHADPHPGNLFVDPENCTLIYIDLGMMGSLLIEQREMLGEVVQAVLRRDSREVVRLLMEIGTAVEDVNESHLRRTVDRIIYRYLGASLTNISFSEMMTEILRAVFANGIRLPGEFAMAVKTLVQGEQVARDLDPEIRIFDVLESISQQMIWQRLDLHNILYGLAMAVRDAARLGRAVPKAANALLAQIERGKLQLGLDIPELEHELNHLYSIINRLVAALILTGMIVGSAIAMGVSPQRTWAIIPILGVIGFIIAMVLAVVLVWSVFMDLLHIRRRRRR